MKIRNVDYIQNLFWNLFGNKKDFEFFSFMPTSWVHRIYYGYVSMYSLCHNVSLSYQKLGEVDCNKK